MKWDLFLSHAGGDLDFASSLQHAVERGSVNGRRLRVWLDDTDIPAGASIPKRIEDGLRDSQRFGILMTRNYFASNSGWTDAEWHRRLDRRERTLCGGTAGGARHCNAASRLGDRAL